jgi:hypothetical protein
MPALTSASPADLCSDAPFLSHAAEETPMDHLQTRLDALEHRTHTVERQLRWWRGFACGLAALAVLTWLLSSSKAVDAQSETLTHRLSSLPDVLEALEGILRHVQVVTTPDGLKEVLITGANLRIVNGLGRTDCGDPVPIPDCPNGLGNLIVGYNELRSPDIVEILGPNDRTGSHMIIVGSQHSFSSFGGLVVGLQNTVSNVFASVSGGAGNTASGAWASVAGGENNTASDVGAAVSGGVLNRASGIDSSISGGRENTASGSSASVSGGGGNTASGTNSAVSGGLNRTAEGDFDWVAGGLFEDE